MRLKPRIRRTAFALAFAITGCTITTSPDTCSSDATVTGCTQGSTGFSCTGVVSPDQGNPSLVCSSGTPGNAGATLYCCVNFGPGTAGTTCKPDVTVSGCATGAQGYACTGTDTPEQGDGSLSCDPGKAGNAGSTVYCCMTTGASGGGADSGSDVGAEASIALEAATGAEAAGDAVSTGDDASGQSDTGAGAGPDGGMCAVTADTGVAACDQCVNSTCCAALVACGSLDDAGADDAGASACEQLLKCTLDCVAGNPDAGLMPGTLTSCQMLCNPSYSSSEQANATGLLQCLTTACGQACP